MRGQAAEAQSGAVRTSTWPVACITQDSGLRVPVRSPNSPQTDETVEKLEAAGGDLYTHSALNYDFDNKNVRAGNAAPASHAGRAVAGLCEAARWPELAPIWRPHRGHLQKNMPVKKPKTTAATGAVSALTGDASFPILLGANPTCRTRPNATVPIGVEGLCGWRRAASSRGGGLMTERHNVPPLAANSRCDWPRRPMDHRYSPYRTCVSCDWSLGGFFGIAAVSRR